MHKYNEHIKINNSTIHKVNGFPNDIWGWGTEDLVLENRTNYYNITTKQEHPEYLLQFNDVYDRVYSRDYMNTYNKHANLFPRLSNEQKLQEIMKTGLNNILNIQS